MFALWTIWNKCKKWSWKIGLMQYSVCKIYLYKLNPINQFMVVLY